MDDVLNSLMLEWFTFHQSQIDPFKKINYKQIIQNPPNEIFNLRKNEYFSSLDQFRNSEKGKNLKPNQIIVDWLINEGENFRHIALTARPLNTIPVLSEWLFKYFGNWIRMFAFVPSHRECENIVKYDEKKAEFLQWLDKADFFIDDNWDNVRMAKEIGVRSFLYPQSWNGGEMTIQEILTEISNSKE